VNNLLQHYIVNEQRVPQWTVTQQPRLHFHQDLHSTFMASWRTRS